jgi:hypothetical protein
MKRSKQRQLTLAIKHLFTDSDGNITRINHKEDYYKNYYFHKKLCEGIAWVAKQEKTTKKHAAEVLMRTGLENWIGEKMGQYITMQREAQQRGECIRRPPFILELIRMARAQSYDITKFF